MSGSYDQHYGFAQNGYDYNNQYQAQSSYPSGGFSSQYQQSSHKPQIYYTDTRSYYPDNGYAQSGSNNSYYNNSQPHAQGPEADRGLLGAAAGGAAGAFGGHKVGHGVLGALGGAILGSLTEDYAKKGKKNKHHKQNASHDGQGIGSFFSRK